MADQTTGPDAPAAARREAVLLGPGEGGPGQLAGPYLIKLGGERTGGSLAVLESTFQPGEGAPPHLHRGHDETFQVVAGRFRFRCGDRVAELGPGGFCHVPRTHPHAFTAIGETPGTMLVVLSPAGFEQFFVEAMRLAADGRPDRALMESILAKYDQELVG
ncbi:cupin domain-containing protein [Kitasatospora sp. LaBMicrA B282]|uniref:cupin domain-containing protein n=1 Tax=Kitasatospora sp. LaBMicrA B282 TaxID=3420949 RepID=UPI003D0D1AA7